MMPTNRLIPAVASTVLEREQRLQQRGSPGMPAMCRPEPAPRRGPLRRPHGGPLHGSASRISTSARYSAEPSPCPRLSARSEMPTSTGSPGRRRGRGTASSTHSRTPRRRSGRPAVGAAQSAPTPRTSPAGRPPWSAGCRSWRRPQTAENERGHRQHRTQSRTGRRRRIALLLPARAGKANRKFDQEWTRN